MGYNATNCKKMALGGSVMTNYTQCKSGTIDKTLVNNATKLWSSDIGANSSTAYYRNFTDTDLAGGGGGRNSSGIMAFCVNH